LIRFSCYRTAQICLNGHVVNDSADEKPHRNEKFCRKCGQPTIMNCPECNERIRGYFYTSNFSGPSIKHPPTFCHNCGKAYPWTNAKLEAAKELIAEDEQLGTDEKELLRLTFPDLIIETPRTRLAISRYKKLTSKSLKVTSEGLKSILIEIASEAIKKMLWPSS
jgi:hypothetical protein